MSRPLRIEYPGAVYHVTSRGNDKQAVFQDDQDRETFLEILSHVNNRYNWLCHAYCLMGTHYHLMIETPDANLSLGMRQLNGVFTQARNKRFKKTGHLFQGRFKAVLIQRGSHLLEVCRYVVLNPVRAHMVERPEEWKWSSYRATAGKEMPPPCLTIDWVLGQFGRSRDKAEIGYKQFVQWGIGKDAPWFDVKGQVFLGDDEFVEGHADYIRKHEDVADIPKSQRYADRPPLDRIFEDRVLRRKKLRNQMMAEAVERYGYRQSELARHLNLHTSTVSNILRSRD